MNNLKSSVNMNFMKVPLEINDNNKSIILLILLFIILFLCTILNIIYNNSEGLFDINSIS